MSAPNDEGNPWLSLADWLRGKIVKKIDVATLAITIEKFGIQTYDRFGRRIPATDEGHDAKASKARALDILAEYYAEQNDVENDLNHDPDRWFEYFSPLYQFGWPKDEEPVSKSMLSESVPQSVKPKIHRLDDPVQTRPRRTYLIIIASLCEHAKIILTERGAAQRIKTATEIFGAPISDDTILNILKEIKEIKNELKGTIN
jgi:hypothetical protein